MFCTKVAQWFRVFALLGPGWLRFFRESKSLGVDPEVCQTEALEINNNRRQEWFAVRWLLSSLWYLRGHCESVTGRDRRGETGAGWSEVTSLLSSISHGSPNLKGIKGCAKMDKKKTVLSWWEIHSRCQMEALVMCLRYIGGLCFTGKGRRIKYQGEKSKKWSDRFFCDVICLTAADSSVLGIVRSIEENSVINPPSCSSKPVWKHCSAEGGKSYRFEKHRG